MELFKCCFVEIVLYQNHTSTTAFVLRLGFCCNVTCAVLSMTKPNKCQQRKLLDSFSYSLSRVNAYKGLASPAYIALASDDPMVLSLALSKELTDLGLFSIEILIKLSKITKIRKLNVAFIEKEFKNEYFRLAEQCRSFSEGIHWYLID